MKRWKLKNKENKLKINTVFGIIVGLFGICCGLGLLIFLEKISGVEFVALSLGFAILGLIIAFAAEVQEFSIAGNSVKLKELRYEAERKIEELDRAKTELFRFMLNQVLQGSQQTLSKIDPRIGSFLRIFDQIQSLGIVNELRREIEHVLHVLLISQYGNLNVIHQSPKTIENNFEELDSPSSLFILLNDEKVSNFMQFTNQYKDSHSAKEDLVDGIHAYAKLYTIKVKFYKLETNNA